VGSAVGAAITNRRVLGPAEARLMVLSASVLLALSVIAVKWPRALTFPLAFVGTWVALALFVRAYKLHRGARSVAAEKERGNPPPPPAPGREGR
jgi:cardiolipin synthase